MHTARHLSYPHPMGGGDVVLILNLPEVFTVGYDAVSFTAKHFGGIRDVPPGMHFFWVAHSPAASARSGFWLRCGPGDDRVHVLRWDADSEDVVASPGDASAYARDLPAYHAKLIPYHDPGRSSSPWPFSGLDDDANNPNHNHDQTSRMWRQLTAHISDRVLHRVVGHAWHVHTADRVEGALVPPAERELDERFPDPPSHTAPALRFAFPQRARTYSAADLGADRSSAARDPTSYIVSTVAGQADEEDMVGELQLAFIVGTHLGNDACLQQWWHVLLRLVLRAHDLAQRRPRLATALLHAVAAQLVYGYGWLGGDVLEGCGDDLRLALIVYKRRLEETLAGFGGGDRGVLDVGNAFAKLEAAAASLGWDIRGEYLRSGRVMLEDGEEVDLELTELEAEDERGEWAPEVVDLDEQGRERGLVSWD